MTREEFAREFMVLRETFRVQGNEHMLEGYWRVFGDMKRAEFSKLVTTALRECKFMPSPAELAGKKENPYAKDFDAPLSEGPVRGR